MPLRAAVQLSLRVLLGCGSEVQRTPAASLLADMGVPDWMIAEILGHSQVVITRKHYIEGTEERHQEALGGLVDALLP